MTRTNKTAPQEHTPRRRRLSNRSWLIAASLVALGALAACAADDPALSNDKLNEAPPLSTADQTCKSMGDYLQQCGAATPCDDALLADCSGVVGLMSEPYLTAMIGCIDAGTSPTACLASSLGSLEPTTAQQALAQQFCSECAFGVPGCVEQFFGEGDDDTAIAGKIIAPLGDDLVDQLKTECATGLGCAATFFDCAKGVLAQQAIPEQTLQCVLGTVTDPSSVANLPTCDTGGSGGSGGSSSSSTSSTGSSSSSSSSSSSTSSTGSSSSSSSSGTGGSGGGGSVCTQLDAEPNDGASTAVDLGEINDCDKNSVTAKGTFVEGSNKDVFKVHVKDTACIMDPKLSSEVTNYQCMYFDCDKGTTEVTCPADATAGVLADGADQYPGCCANTKLMTPKLQCKGTPSESADVYVVHKGHIVGPYCLDYSLTVSF